MKAASILGSDEDPRADLPCPLGLKKDGMEHAPETADGYLHQCPCGAWQKGTLMDFSALETGPKRCVIVSDRQLLRLIQAGLIVPASLREAVERRLAGPA